MGFPGNDPAPVPAGVEFQVNKGVANGYAPLDATAKVPLVNLPPLGGSLYWKDPVFTFSALPMVGNTVNDVRMVTLSGVIYKWNGASWDRLDEFDGYSNANRNIDTLMTLGLPTTTPKFIVTESHTETNWSWPLVLASSVDVCIPKGITLTLTGYIVLPGSCTRLRFYGGGKLIVQGGGGGPLTVLMGSYGLPAGTGTTHQIVFDELEEVEVWKQGSIFTMTDLTPIVRNTKFNMNSWVFAAPLFKNLFGAGPAHFENVRIEATNHPLVARSAISWNGPAGVPSRFDGVTVIGDFWTGIPIDIGGNSDVTDLYFENTSAATASLNLGGNTHKGVTIKKTGAAETVITALGNGGVSNLSGDVYEYQGFGLSDSIVNRLYARNGKSYKGCTITELLLDATTYVAANFTDCEIDHVYDLASGTANLFQSLSHKFENCRFAAAFTLGGALPPVSTNNYFSGCTFVGAMIVTAQTQYNIFESCNWGASNVTVNANADRNEFIGCRCNNFTDNGDHTAVVGGLGGFGGVRTTGIQVTTGVLYNVVQADTYIGVNRAAAFTVALPAAASNRGRTLTIADESGNASTYPITIDPSGAELINGAATLVLGGDYDSVQIRCNGTAWFVVS